MARDEKNENAEETIDTPPPGDDSTDEHDRIRQSNDIDQRLEREGIVSQHNRGYDDAVKGIRPSRLD
ncbi:MAG TPA: hypothetical protein VN628_15555 [Vicinamibacterales bacterium]|nr:hypothetical protein [Vicinamibacterales bacterium]